MSKASEWADRISNPPAPLLYMCGSQRLGEVMPDGRLAIPLAWLTPEEACHFARWILDTFGEEATR